MYNLHLEQLGLTKNQSAVYLALLKLGSTTAQSIIKESGLHRSRVYDSLERLEDLGLVSFVVKDFKKYFQAANPEKLLDYIDEKKEIVNQILPELKKLEGMKKEEIKKKIKFTLKYDKKEIKDFEKDIVKRRLFEGKPLPRDFESKSVVNIF